MGDECHRIAWSDIHILEYKLLTADEEAFNELYVETMQKQMEEGGPPTTGDRFIDALEKSLYENLKKGKGVPDGWE